jgi:hypothetical protein
MEQGSSLSTKLSALVFWDWGLYFFLADANRKGRLKPASSRRIYFSIPENIIFAYKVADPPQRTA